MQLHSIETGVRMHVCVFVCVAYYNLNTFIFIISFNAYNQLIKQGAYSLKLLH